MQRAVVTGANGFIGTWLVKELVSSGVSVIAVVRDETSISNNLNSVNVQGIVPCTMDQIDELYDILQGEKIDTFYHLAWEGSSGPQRSDYTAQLQNVKYSCDCAVVAKKLGAQKFISTGTITERIAQSLPQRDVNAQNTMYGLAKHTTRCLLDVTCRELELSYVWAQLSNIFGSNSPGNIVSYTLGELLQGKSPSFSKADQPYDLMYVKDTSKALFMLGENFTNHHCYFVGSGKPRLLKDYLLEIQDIFGGQIETGIGKRPDDGLLYHLEWFDTTALYQDTGFTAEYSFAEAIREYLFQDWQV